MTATLPTRTPPKLLLALGGGLAVALLAAVAIGLAGPKPAARCTRQGAQALALERTRDEFDTRGRVTYFRWVAVDRSAARVFVRDGLTDQSRLLDESCSAGRWRVTSDQTG